ncbi:MAG: cell division protein FtsQ/DivIB [Candidatus Omnitrophica bacterium]|nr:cell division protein FtsQ/DivIB [Candidatus Omnitrophota bacterium]
MEKKNRKIEEIRQRIALRKKKKFKILFFLLSFCFVIYGLYFIKMKVLNFLWNLEIFKIKEIKIYPESLSPLIKELLELEKDKNLLFLDIENLREKINSISEVENCKIIRIFPSALQINIILKVPWAVLEDRGKKYVIDKNGVIINRNYENIPLKIYGVKVNEEKNRVEELEKIFILKELDKWYNYFNIKNFFKIDSIDISDLNKIEINDGARKIYFTRENIKEKSETLYIILKNLKNDFEYIDTRFKNFIIKFK